MHLLSGVTQWWTTESYRHCHISCCQRLSDMPTKTSAQNKNKIKTISTMDFQFQLEIEIPSPKETDYYKYLLYSHNYTRTVDKLTWYIPNKKEELQNKLLKAMERKNFEEKPLTLEERRVIIVLGNEKFVSIFAIIPQNYPISFNVCRYVDALNYTARSQTFEDLLDYPLLVGGLSFLRDSHEPDKPLSWLRKERETYFVILLASFANTSQNTLGFV